MPCSNPNPENLSGYIEVGIIAKYDTSPETRELHSGEMEAWRKRRKIEVKVSQTKREEKREQKITCSHPKAKLLVSQDFVQSYEIVPYCPRPNCFGHLVYEERLLEGREEQIIQFYRCEDCGRTTSLRKYDKLKEKAFMKCPKCGRRVGPQKEYPWILECPRCKSVYPPEKKHELISVKVKCYPKTVCEEVLEGEDVIDGDLYECPVYGETKRPKGDQYCKFYCGYRTT